LNRIVSALHEPVLLTETISFLRNGAGLYLDATVGDGGHAFALLAAEPAARLLACDRDAGSLKVARQRLSPYEGRVTFAHCSFRGLPEAHGRLGNELLSGALLDLGLSSRQLDDPGRGMSFAAEAPLDLRLDTSTGQSAAARLSQVGDAELTQVLREHGDLPRAGALARAIVRAAAAGRLATTRDLVLLIDQVRGGRSHPRTYARVFQALRIWVNEEAEDLDAILAWLPEVMRVGAVVVTLAYHSGEDRRIKQVLRPQRMESRRLPPSDARPRQGPWEELTRKVVTPTDGEIARNPRARSARLRAFRRKLS
jgi:16S rRNA (cytosine1402-N4)-methyltransferase